MIFQKQNKWVNWIAWSVLGAGLLLQGCTATPKSVPPASESRVAFDSVTYWNTNYGPMRIEIENGQGKGTYPNYQGSFIFQDKGVGWVEGYWIQPEAHRQCNVSKEGSTYWGTVEFFRITKDRLQGRWAYCDDPAGSGGNWDGVRIGHSGL